MPEANRLTFLAAVAEHERGMISAEDRDAAPRLRLR